MFSLTVTGDNLLYLLFFKTLELTETRTHSFTKIKTTTDINIIVVYSYVPTKEGLKEISMNETKHLNRQNPFIALIVLINSLIS